MFGNTKKCKIEKCNNPVWSLGLCKNHIPRKPLPKNGGGLTRVKDKVPNRQINDMKKFFLQFWKENKEHTCENCRTWLGPEPLTYMFDHVLEKSKYPDLAFEPENIMYLCLQCHSRKTNGYLSEIMKNRVDYVKNKFNIL